VDVGRDIGMVIEQALHSEEHAFARYRLTRVDTPVDVEPGLFLRITLLIVVRKMGRQNPDGNGSIEPRVSDSIDPSLRHRWVQESHRD
jgi:hypothetical protein